MSELSLNQALPKKALFVRKRQAVTAQDIYQKIFQSASKKTRAQQLLVTLGRLNVPTTQNPPNKDLEALISLYNQDSLHKASELAKQLTIEFPRAFMVWNILGAACHRLGQTDEADTAFRKVVLLNPSYPDGHNNLGTLFTQQGRLDEAVASYRKAIAINPEHAEAFNNLGLALQDQTKLDEAIIAYRSAIQILPDYSEAFNNLGNALKSKGELNSAIDSFHMALTYKPNFAEAFNNLGTAFHEDGKFESAITAYQSAISSKHDYAEAHYNMANTLQGLGHLDQAIDAYQGAIDIKPNYAEAFHNMGSAFQDEGKMDQAKEAYNNAIVFKPDYVMAFHHLSVIKTFASGDPQIRRLEKLIGDPCLTDDDRCRLFFVSAKVQEDLGHLSKSLGDLKQGGKLRQQLLSYQIKHDEKLFDDIKQTAECVKNQPISSQIVQADPIPIFILGMPRSGTSLVEQIITCHEEVLGAGELELFSHLSAEVATANRADNPEQLLDIRQAYLEELQKLSKGYHYVTDKYPHNFLYVGLIARALPEAKIIHVTRNPAATCWSNFKTFFSSNGLGYSYDLKDVVNYYRLYEDLMDYWYQQYSQSIYRLDYDLLTANQETETKKLIAHLDLEWEPACLAPHENKRIIQTASQQQVKQRLYRDSSKEWRKFEPFLDGAFEELL